MPSVKYVNDTPNSAIAEKLLETANDVALRYAQNYTWSLWHAWDYLDRLKAIADDLRQDRFFWSELQSGNYGTSLGASIRIIDDLQAKLRSHSISKLHQYAENVQLMTSTQSAAGEGRYHAVVAMCFRGFAIVIDHVHHPTAFRVYIGNTFEMLLYIAMDGLQGQERFYYFQKNGEYKLTMDKKVELYTPEFSEMNANEATKEITFRAAREKRHIDKQKQHQLPPSKHLAFRSLLDEEPKFISAEPVDKKWLASTVRILVDFATTRICMRIPRDDWSQSEYWLPCLHTGSGAGLYVNETVATALIVQNLDAVSSEGPSSKEMTGINLMGMICKEVNLDSELPKDMVKSVYRAWAPIRKARQVNG